MAKLFDSQGNEVEAFTKEEVDAKKKEELDAYLKDHPDNKAELDKLKQDLADANKKLEDGTMSEGQKQRLLDDKKKAEEALANGTKDLQDSIKALNARLDAGDKETLGKKFDSLAKGDKNVREKIELFYKSFKDDSGLTADQRLEAAYTSAVGSKPAPGLFDGITSGGRGEHQPNDGGVKVETDASREMRKNFGISDQVAEKYNPSNNK